VFLKYFLFLEIYQNNICLFKKIIKKIFKKKIKMERNASFQTAFRVYSLLPNLIPSLPSGHNSSKEDFGSYMLVSSGWIGMENMKLIFKQISKYQVKISLVSIYCL